MIYLQTILAIPVMVILAKTMEFVSISPMIQKETRNMNVGVANHFLEGIVHDGEMDRVNSSFQQLERFVKDP